MRSPTDNATAGSTADGTGGTHQLHHRSTAPHQQQQSYATPQQTNPPYQQQNQSYYAGAANNQQQSYAQPQQQQTFAVPQQQQYQSSVYSSSNNTAAGTGIANQQQKSCRYKHNRTTGILWIISTMAVLYSVHAVTTPEQHTFLLHCFGTCALLLYGSDLANIRDLSLYMLCFSTIAMSVVLLAQSLFTMTMLSSSHGVGTMSLSYRALYAVCLVLYCIQTALWAVMQFRWLPVEKRIFLQSTLHGLIPFVLGGTVTLASSVAFIVHSDDAGGGPASLHLTSYILAIFISMGMLVAGTTKSNFASSDDVMGKDEDHAKKTVSSTKVSFCITRSVAKYHCTGLILLPPVLHMVISFNKNDETAALTNVYDYVLAITFPYILLFFVVCKLQPSSLYGSVMSSSSNTTVATGISSTNILVFLVTATVAIQRYLIQMSHSFAYHLMGSSAGTTLIGIYWTVASAAVLGALFIWGRTKSDGQLVFGEYHEDIVQSCLALTGLSIGKAFGLPWNMTPLPVLGILGLSLWVTTRMLRYLGIFLFVLHATGVVVFTYRFVGIETTLPLPIPNVELNLTRYGTVVTVTSVLVGLLAGMAVRSSGGWMSPALRSVDATGLLLIVYTLLLTVLEISLLKRPIPLRELTGVNIGADHVDEMLYGPGATFLTTALLLATGYYMKRRKMIYEKTLAVSSSLAIGKAIAVFIETSDTAAGGRTYDTRGTGALWRVLVAALLCMVMFAPRIFLKPIYVKASYKKYQAIPPDAMQQIFFYACVFLPATLLATIPQVVFPLVNVLATGGSYHRESYYDVSIPLSELIGSVLALWGISCISTLKHILPDGGGEAFKTLAALAFLMGVGIYFAAPTVGMSVGLAANNPYASFSSLGAQLVDRSKSRTGGWGLLSAILATLLAALGPLELKERKNATGKKDMHVLFRTMMFGIMFGCGVAWFITVTIMSEAEWMFLALSLLASMSLAFLGTVAAVLGYYVEIDNFEEVDQVAKIWATALVLFTPIGGIPQLIRAGSVHPFGAGGWLSTYLIVASLSALAFSLSLSLRSEKTAMTKGLGNLGCVVSWICAVYVVLVRYGVAGLDGEYHRYSFAGIPTSIIATMFVGLILFTLDGDRSGGSRRRSTVPGTHKTDRSLLRLNLSNLTAENRWFPPYFGSIVALLLATVFAIFFRGSPVLKVLGLAPIAKTATTGTIGGWKLSLLAISAVSQNYGLSASSKLAETSIWTASSFFGPLLHIVGLILALPGMYFLTRQIWLRSSSGVPPNQFLVGLAMNLFPLFIARNVPSLQAAVVLSTLGLAYQAALHRQR